MNYKTTFLEKIRLFPEDLQNERLWSIWLIQYSNNTNIDPEIEALTTVKQCKTIIKMLEFGKWNETVTTTIWILASSTFYISKIYDWTEIWHNLNDLSNLFIHYLELPAWHCWYPTQAELVDDIIHRLQKVINIASEMN